MKCKNNLNNLKTISQLSVTKLKDYPSFTYTKHKHHTNTITRNSNHQYLNMH